MGFFWQSVLRISDPLLKGKGMGSLCMVLVDGTFVECSNEEVSVEANSLEREVQLQGPFVGDTLREELPKIDWLTNSLTTFNNCLGMPNEGFGNEILSLFRKMKDGREAKGNKARKRRKKVISKFERELKKLECSMNYLGVTGNGNGSGKGG